MDSQQPNSTGQPIAPLRCPSCKSRVKASDIECPMCGYNLRTNESHDPRDIVDMRTSQIQTSAPKPTRQSPTQSPAQPAAAPKTTTPVLKPIAVAKPTPKANSTVVNGHATSASQSVARKPTPKPNAVISTASGTKPSNSASAAAMTAALLNSASKAKANAKPTKRAQRFTIHPISALLAVICMLLVGAFVLIAASRNASQFADPARVQQSAQAQGVVAAITATPTPTIAIAYASANITSSNATTVSVEATSTPTDTPLPTATNTPEPTLTATPIATNTPQPTATETTLPTPTATRTPRPTNTPRATATGLPASSSAVYVVRAGDTCLVIARKVGVELKDLVAANKLNVNRCFLQIGDRLIIPGAEVPTPTVEITLSATLTTTIVETSTLAADSALTPTATPEAPTTYVVRAGDTCQGIALRYGVKVEELAAANKLRVSYCLIRPGDHVIVPTPRP